MTSAASVVVVGAGMLGASAAYFLARAGRRVVVLEAGEPASGASGNSFAWVNAVRKEPEAYHRLNAEGQAAYASLPAELGADVGYRVGGSIEWAEGGDVAELRARVARLASRGYPARWITPAIARRIEPGLAVPDDAEIAFYDSDGWVDAPRLVSAFLGAARTHGADVRTGHPARALRRRGDRVEAVVTDAGDVVADDVVLTSGVGVPDLLDPVGVKIPMRRVPGILGVTSGTAVRLGRVVHAPGIHLRPDVSGGLLLGATDLDAFVTDMMAPGAPPPFVQPLLDRARRVFPSVAQATLVSVRIGVRPIPEDGHTVAGPLPGLLNGWVVVTHSAVTMGPLLGRLIAEEVCGAAPSPLLAPFRPARFA